MTNHFKWAVLAATLGIMIAGEAQAIAVSRCTRIVRDPQVNRETLVNTCQQCVVSKLERRRPGNNAGVPNLRDFNMPGGSSLLLPFMGPGVTRITGELPCPAAQ